MDTRFCLDGKWLDTPAGIAHYLEHKMFDTKEGNALQELAKNGAEPNAFTSNAMTGYYFDSTEHFEENLEILLSFVSIPYFTEESVAKEQGIIGQEIRMIEDNPDWQIYTRMMQALYQKQHRPDLHRRHGGEHLPHHGGDAVRLPQGILHPLQHDPDGGGRRGPDPCGGPWPGGFCPGRAARRSPGTTARSRTHVAAKETCRGAWRWPCPQFLVGFKCAPAADGEDYLPHLPCWVTWPATFCWGIPARCICGSMSRGSSTPASAAPLR